MWSCFSSLFVFYKYSNFKCFLKFLKYSIYSFWRLGFCFIVLCYVPEWHGVLKYWALENSCIFWSSDSLWQCRSDLTKRLASFLGNSHENAKKHQNGNLMCLVNLTHVHPDRRSHSYVFLQTVYTLFCDLGIRLPIKS